MLESVKLGLSKVGAFGRKAKNKAASVAGTAAVIAGSVPASAADVFGTGDDVTINTSYALAVGALVLAAVATIWGIRKAISMANRG